MMSRGSSNNNEEVSKLQQHLSLLRDQYSLLQERCNKLQREKEVAVAAAGSDAAASSSFASRLLTFVGQLHNKAEYSDIEVRVAESQVLRAHKFVLAARSAHWDSLAPNETLDWCGLGAGVGEAVLKWVYSGDLDKDQDTDFMMLLMTAASKLSLPHLLSRCEEVMVGRVTVRNCVKLYTTADEIGAATLRDHCSSLISAHWDDFTSEDFSHMSGPLLYAMFKSKTPRPLHAAVRHRREDVLFLYLIEYRTQLGEALEARDDTGSPVLEVALSSGQQSVADTLLEHGADVNTRDASGATLLHRAVTRGDEFSATYLLQHGASVNSQQKSTGRTPLHVLVTGDTSPLHSEDAANTSTTTYNTNLANTAHHRQHHLQLNGYNNNGYSYPARSTTTTSTGGGSPSHSSPEHSSSSRRSPSPAFSNSGHCSTASTSSFTASQKVKLCKLLLEKGADPNIQDSDKRSVFHCGVLSGEREVFSALLQYTPLHLELLDSAAHTALWYALFHDTEATRSCRDQGSIASMLLSHGADLNAVVGAAGDSLLHVAGQRGAEEAGLFLTEGGAKVNSLNKAGEAPLHCSCTTGLPALTAALLKHGANPNSQTSASVLGSPQHKATPAAQHSSQASSHHYSQGLNNNNTFTTNLSHATSLSVSSRSSNDTSPSTNPFDEPDSPPPHAAAASAALEAVSSGVPAVLAANASSALSSPAAGLMVPVYRQTPLHRAITNCNEGDVRAILQHKGCPLELELRDSEDCTALACALSLGQLTVAELLLAAGASVLAVDALGRSYLHAAVEVGDVEAAAFLLQHGADPNMRNREGQTALELCIHGGVEDMALLEQLCRGGAGNVAAPGAGGGGVLAKDPPLWQALEAGRMEVAALLVKYGADKDWWHYNGDSHQHTLLHRAIDQNLEEAAVFLLGSGCDANSPRRSQGAAPPDLLTPLHLCASYGLHLTAQALVEHGAKVNAKDAEGKTPLHLAIENGHPSVLQVLLAQPSLDLAVRDKAGTTPFAAAMTRRNNQAAKAILDKEPKAAQQLDHKGHNFLHVAVAKNDLESVLFLLSIHVDLSTRTRDDQQLNPLHLATITGSELLVRNLLLAGSDINALTPHRQTVLHLAAQHDHSHLAPVLLENRVLYDALDADLNNALHIAVKNGHVAMTRALLSECEVSATALNLRGQNPLHLLACHQPTTAPAIAKLFLEAMPDYPLNDPDVHGNTALLLSYQRGGGQLCRVLVAAGASLGISNNEGENLFNSAVASRALLAALLDSLSTEPPWAEGDNCMECAAKFSLATRRHHCRHCGRLLCSKCSDKLQPILKFSLNKPVRVCHICSQVLTLGPAALT